MDYTREPIVETVITPKDGYRIAVRNSKVPGQEEYIVEALEVVSFGTNCFFRNLERPRAFMVPASDYEVLEVRETRVALKAASLEGTVRTPPPPHREVSRPHREVEKREMPAAPKEPSAPFLETEEVAEEEELTAPGAAPATPVSEGRPDRRRERRRGQRRRRGGREEGGLDEGRSTSSKADLPQVGLPPVLEPTSPLASGPAVIEVVKEPSVAPILSTVIPPPTTLIRDDLERLRKNKQYEGAFYIREPEEVAKVEPEDDDAPVVPLRLQEEEEIKVSDEPSFRPHEENSYKATPAPIDDELVLPWEEGVEPRSSSEKGPATPS